MSRSSKLACRDCDLLLRWPEVPPSGSARCPRCDCLLLSPHRNGRQRTTALAISAAIFFVLAHAFPFLSMRMQGRLTDMTLVSGVTALASEGLVGVALLVAITAVIMPALHVAGLLYVVMPLDLGFVLPGARQVFLWMRRIEPWSMVEVYLLGVLVSLVKLRDMAEINPGIALWSFVLLMPTLIAARVILDPQFVWESLEARGVADGEAQA